MIGKSSWRIHLFNTIFQVNDTDNKYLSQEKEVFWIQLQEVQCEKRIAFEKWWAVQSLILKWENF